MADGAISGNSSSSKSLMWMTAALFAGMAALLVGGLFLAGRVIRSVGIRSSVGPQTVRTQNGVYQLEREREVGPPVPMYPGATLVIASDESAAQSVKDAENGTAKVIYVSNDPRDMVDQWYGDHLPKGFERYDASTAPFPDFFQEAGVRDTDIAYSAEKNGHTRIVELSVNPSGTKITIIRIDKPEANDSNPPQP
jgi:hypothetical protein